MNFVVKKCNQIACRYYRFGDKCAKDGLDISKQIENNTKIHSNNLCEIKKQIDIYRLENMLED